MLQLLMHDHHPSDQVTIPFLRAGPRQLLDRHAETGLQSVGFTVVLITSGLVDEGGNTDLGERLLDSKARLNKPLAFGASRVIHRVMHRLDCADFVRYALRV